MVSLLTSPSFTSPHPLLHPPQVWPLQDFDDYGEFGWGSVRALNREAAEASWNGANPGMSCIVRYKEEAKYECEQ